MILEINDWVLLRSTSTMANKRPEYRWVKIVGHTSNGNGIYENSGSPFPRDYTARQTIDSCPANTITFEELMEKYKVRITE